MCCIEITNKHTVSPKSYKVMSYNLKVLCPLNAKKHAVVIRDMYVYIRLIVAVINIADFKAHSCYNLVTDMALYWMDDISEADWGSDCLSNDPRCCRHIMQNTLDKHGYFRNIKIVCQHECPSNVAQLGKPWDIFYRCFGCPYIIKQFVKKQ